MVQLNLRVPDHTRRDLRAAADSCGTSLSNTVRDLCHRHGMCHRLAACAGVDAVRLEVLVTLAESLRDEFEHSDPSGWARLSHWVMKLKLAYSVLVNGGNPKADVWAALDAVPVEVNSALAAWVE